jgi:KipI family sensor histidine kinase inhibitor
MGNGEFFRAGCEACVRLGGVRWVPYGPHAMLIYFADAVGDAAFATGRGISAALEKHPPPGLWEFVPSFTSVLLEFLPDCAFDPEQVVRELAAVAPISIESAPLKRVPVRYDGPDLGRVAEHAGLGEREVAELHAGTIYKVYALGFSPGFPYLGDLDLRLHTPRLSSPRARVPAGAVAIGGEHTGIYPSSGPGGWNLIGTTNLRLFVPEEEQADRRFFLQPGDRVRFEPMK